jgi:flavodoxin
MKTIILYGSTRGSTERVVEALSKYLTFYYEIKNVKSLQSSEILNQYDLLIFFSPTYGDEELQDDMEKFLSICNNDLSNKFYAICELGNYYGYDDFSFGAMKIIRRKLDALNAKQLIQPLSMDSLPKKDWNALEKWCQLLNEKLCQI